MKTNNEFYNDFFKVEKYLKDETKSIKLSPAETSDYLSFPYSDFNNAINKFLLIAGENGSYYTDSVIDGETYNLIETLRPYFNNIVLNGKTEFLNDIYIVLGVDSFFIILDNKDGKAEKGIYLSSYYPII